MRANRLEVDFWQIFFLRCEILAEKKYLRYWKKAYF